MLIPILTFIAGTAISTVVVYIIMSRHVSKSAATLSASEASRAELQIQLQELKAAAAQERTESARNLAEAVQQAQDRATKLATSEAAITHLNEKLQEQRKEFENLSAQFKEEFENLATRILKANSAEFAEQSKTNLETLLAPLKTNISEFKQQVENTYRFDSEDRIVLKTEIKQLSDMNKFLGDEAGQLARALKSDSKQQGCWGELVLETVLENSGLRQGKEYSREVQDKNADNDTIRPDAIINLPEGRHIIVDSKVSLTAYTELVSATEEEAYAAALKRHIASIRSHVRTLAEKHYPSAKNLNTPDFVLLFLSIESSFAIAVKEDATLLDFAWGQKIIIVSPSTLLAALKTIQSFWTVEKQKQNAIAIAQAGGDLYDKFVGFLSDMQSVGAKLSAAQASHNDAMNKLSSGKGNLIGRVEKIKTLGAKANKVIPADLLAESDDEDDPDIDNRTNLAE